MLKVIVDATPIVPRPSGVGFHVANLIHALNSLQAKENFELGIVYQPSLKKWLINNLTFPDCIRKYANVYMLPLPVRVSNLLLPLSYKFNLFNFDKYLDFPDIIHGTNYSVYPCKKSLKVLNIYDLTFFKYPQYIDSVVKTYKDRIRQCLQWTDLVITISESSKADIIEYLKVEPSRVYVTPLASRYYPNYLFNKLIDQPENLVYYDFSQPYILFVSTIEPRKNIAALISAFEFLKQKYKVDHQLIIIGQKGWHYKSILSKIENSPWKSHIHHLDYLPDELVALFYSKADVFVYPSHYEGFGLPVLEAMTLGAPVITSNTSSLPEVAGDAAILIDPNEPTDLAEAILRVISDSQLRCELIHKGKERAKLYSWERTAKETIKAYKSLLE